METHEEDMATWASISNASLQSLRVLKGSLALNANDPDRQVRVSEERIECDQIGTHLLNNSDLETSDDQNPPNLWHFKAISFPRLQPGRLELSFPRHVFQQIQELWNLHPRTIEVFLSNNGVFTTFHSSSNKQTFLLFKVANSRSTGFDCISVTCDSLRRTTFALYHHLEDEASVFATLRSTPEWCIDPYFFLAAMYRSHHQRIETHRNRIDDAVRNIEWQTGFRYPGRVMGFGTNYRASLDEFYVLEDPRSTFQQLSRCQTDLACMGHAARCCLACGEGIVQAIDDSLHGEPPQPDHQEQCNGSEQRRRNWRCLESQRAIRLMVRQEVEYIRRRTAMILSQVQAVRERAQSQTSFTLNIITQSDAEYTAAIAVHGVRDSIAMKTISVLGVIFLPGTYIATLLGMNMFTWGTPDGEEISSLKVSPSMWIYWAITVPLTVVTFLVWLLWSRRETHESSKRFMAHRTKASVHAEGVVSTKSSCPISNEKMV